jgi:hypothetical protein
VLLSGKPLDTKRVSFGKEAAKPKYAMETENSQFKKSLRSGIGTVLSSYGNPASATEITLPLSTSTWT